jgi:hypothetical protein
MHCATTLLSTLLAGKGTGYSLDPRCNLRVQLWTCTSLGNSGLQAVISRLLKTRPHDINQLGKTHTTRYILANGEEKGQMDLWLHYFQSLVSSFRTVFTNTAVFLTLLHPLSNQFKVEWLKQKSAILASLRP